MGDTPKTLAEIRSEACNTILVAFTTLAIPAAGASVLRGLEQGFRPVMAIHVLLLLVLLWTTVRRRHLAYAFRATIVIAVPYTIAVGGLLAYGRGTGVMMFFVSSCLIAGCFFNRRTALAVVALCVVSLAVIYIGYRLDLVDIPPPADDMTLINWLTLTVGFTAAGAAPIIGLSALLQSLETERRRADEAVKIRSDFLAHMSHELRTPMAGVIGMAEALKVTRLDAQQQSFVANLMHAGRNLLALLNDLLDFSKFEAGAIPLEKRPFSISDAITTTCALFEARVAQKGLTLSMKFPPSFQDMVVGDAYRIGHILSNLIDNAIKFTDRGGISVTVGQARLGDGRLQLECAIADTGIGLSSEQAQRIFEPFIQADTSISRRYGGSGLGLAICRRLLDAMGGTIAVASTPGQGATFTVVIPLIADNTPDVSAPAPMRASSSAPPEPLRRGDGALRLLIAEDDANMQKLVDIMLPRMGHVVTVVHDGAAAVAAAAANTYDCIIMDMHMPVMTGPEAMRYIHQAEAKAGRGRRTPMIALTADLIPDHVRTFVEAGADAVVGKPVDWATLELKIRQLTRPRVIADTVR